jgi:hypothetical protein
MFVLDVWSLAGDTAAIIHACCASQTQV